MEIGRHGIEEHTVVKCNCCGTHNLLFNEFSRMTGKESLCTYDGRLMFVEIDGKEYYTPQWRC